MLAADVIERSFTTAFPQGAEKDNLGSPIVVVRVDPATLQLPPERSGWAPEGLLVYSKIRCATGTDTRSPATSAGALRRSIARRARALLR